MRLLLAAAIVAAGSALAAPPPNANPEWREFFRGLKENETGASCCDISDCRVTRSRAGANGWQAVNQLGEWVDVPDAKILTHRHNPTGEAVMCWLPHRGVICFLPPIGT
jgi:hypothetical protein